MHDKSLTETKQNLVNRKFSYINTFDHQGPAVVRALRDLTSGLFEHPVITYPLNVYQRFNYKHRLLRGDALKEYKAVLEECKETANDISGDQWALSEANCITVGRFLTWAKEYGTDVNGNY